ncbi:sugar transferase [Roseivivax sp. CAU 1753]
MSITDVSIAAAAPRLSYSRAGKRGLDLVLALCLLPLIAPIICILALLIRTDGAPAFFIHTRVGMNGRRFGCLKLRTMRMDAQEALTRHLADNPDAAREWDRTRKLRRDPRVTPLGGILRRASLDELPQIWNVIRGEMSLVGPRPVTDAELHLYQADLPAYLALRPGITGIWQVEARSSGCYVQRVACDRTYARTLGFRGDLWILLRTARVLIIGTGS